MIFRHTDLLEAGVDEVGRGCIAGPVMAGAAVVLDGFYHPRLNDSKKMTEKGREEVFNYITHSGLCVYGIGSVGAIEIDEIGIVPATMKAMHLAIHDLEDKLKKRIEFLLVDGNYFTSEEYHKYECMIKGDGRFVPIAAASVAAKVTRDRLMIQMSKAHKEYGWGNNKGYGTASHINAVRENGYSCQHRKTFNFL